MNSKLIFILIGLFIHETLGHGLMLDPPNRSSRWRYNSSAPINYNDNQNFCGGFGTQFGVSNGSCGVCGDSYLAPHPQDNENTGKYGQGVVVAEYPSNSVINVTILITANHFGSFTYSLCVLEDFNAPEPGEECFETLLLEDGSTQSSAGKYVGIIVDRVQLPEIQCERCVLRWTYKAGNSWGFCGDGTGALGCGNQEHFRSCADISIV